MQIASMANAVDMSLIAVDYIVSQCKSICMPLTANFVNPGIRYLRLLYGNSTLQF